MEILIFLAIIGGIIFFNILKVKKMSFSDFIAQMQKNRESPLKATFNEKKQQYETRSQQINDSFKQFTRMLKKRVFYGLGIVIITIFLLNAITIIPAGYTGVMHLFGKVRDNELSSGFHLINPFASVEKMSIRTEEYTMSVAQNEGVKKNDDSIRALTNEGLNIDLDITVFYRLEQDKASDVYRELGLNYIEKIIRPEIRGAIREIVAQYDSKAIYSDKRSEVAMGIQDRLSNSINPRGILVEQVLLRNVTLPEKLASSIEEKLQAEQESQRYDFVLEREKKEAERKRIEATGQRDAQTIINESLTPAYLEYLYIRELKDREGTIYIPTDPNSGIPLFRSVQ
jgi:regulator of protease activity HflC (stomatin/prohibitin superfamily)